MTTTKSLEQLIKAKKLNYVNSDITEANFPAPKNISTAFKLYHFDRNISSEEAIKEMAAEGYQPANLYELLSYDWNGKGWVIALGSVAGVRGRRDVPHLDRGGSERRLSLRWFDHDWDADFRFLAVRNLSFDTRPSAPGLLEPLTLESAIKMVKEAGYQVAKII